MNKALLLQKNVHNYCQNRLSNTFDIFKNKKSHSPLKDCVIFFNYCFLQLPHDTINFNNTETLTIRTFMKIYAHSFGSAGAITIGLWYTIIAVSMKMWPYEILKFISSSHMIPRLENLAPYIKITSMGIITGLAVHCLFGYIFFWLIASLYNLFTSSTN